MESLGFVLNISKSKNLIVKTSKQTLLKQGRKVLSEKEKAIGRVREIFGPVNSPYISVKPLKQTRAEKLLGKEVFIG